jgi:hypothetical protein
MSWILWTQDLLTIEGAGSMMLYNVKIQLTCDTVSLSQKNKILLPIKNNNSCSSTKGSNNKSASITSIHTTDQIMLHTSTHLNLLRGQLDVYPNKLYKVN